MNSLDLKLESKIIESKVIELTVRNCFYHGLFGKLKCVGVWLLCHNKKPFKDYLASPVSYNVEIGNEIQNKS